MLAPLVLLAACGGSGGSSGVSAVSTAVSVPISKQANYVKVCVNGDIAGTGTCPLEPVLTASTASPLTTDWGCVLDKGTGLLWEANLYFRNDAGSPNITQFTNYTSTETLQKWVGDPLDPLLPHKAFAATQTEIDSIQNATGYKNWVNQKSLCGNARWRIPNKDELQNLYIEHRHRQHLIPGGLASNPQDFLVDKFFPITYSEAYITSTWTVRAGFGKIDGEDLFSDAVSFYGYGNNEIYLWPLSSATRQHGHPLRLVADCNCKLVGQTQAVRNWGRSVLLPDGSVLTVGDPSATTFAEKFNPSTELWTSASAFAASDVPLLPSQRHSATLVGNKVVVVGGATSSGLNNKTWIYDTTLQTWSAGRDALTRHIAHSAIALGAGKLLVLGGDCTLGSAVACTSGSVEEYDVSANTWTAKAPMPTPLQSMSATLLQDGRILLAGGSDNFSSTNLVQIYDPVSNTWAARTNSMNESRYYHSATLLQDGRVLVSGGNSVSRNTGNGNVVVPSKTAEIFDPRTNVWAFVASMSVERVLHSASVLSDGRVIAAGGAGKGGTSANATDTVEIYDPLTNTWALACSLRNLRYGHTTTMLADGARFLVSGGLNPSASLRSAEIFTP
jgi:N-acetylneuraminic acid mutarotase